MHSCLFAHIHTLDLRPNLPYLKVDVVCAECLHAIHVAYLEVHRSSMHSTVESLPYRGATPMILTVEGISQPTPPPQIIPAAKNPA